MKKSKMMRGLSDVELLALIESLPEGVALLDADGHALWGNRLARQLLAMRATTGPTDCLGTELAVLVGRLIDIMPASRIDEYARWMLASGVAVEIKLQRLWASRVALWLSTSSELERATSRDESTPAPTAKDLIVAERLLEESVVGLVVADGAGGIDWMNPQARRLLGGASKRSGRNAQRTLARAARHVAKGNLPAPLIRTQLDLETRDVEARIWSVAPGLAGVLFGEEAGELGGTFRGEAMSA